MGRQGYCEFCGDRGPVAEICFRQNTGMLVVRQSREWRGNACRACGKSTFWRATLHTLVLGWWGTISMFVTPVFLVLNVVNLVEVLRLPSAIAVRRTALDSQREYAQNLLRTKDRQTVVEVLVQATGATVDEVEAFVTELWSTASRA